MRTLRNLVGSSIKGYPPLYRQINRLRKWRLHEPSLEMDHRVLGTFYGGWAIPEGYLRPESIVYSVGVGTDISFDLALVSEYGCKVFAFDPTPIAIEFMATLNIPDEITFVPVGLSSHDGVTTFFAPQKRDPTCFSRVNPDGDSAEVVEYETLTLASIMKRLGHQRVDLLKMDIEGFEYEVVEEILSSHNLPACLLVEFHHLIYGIDIQQTYKAVESLVAVGYQLFWVSNLGREYGFILASDRTASQSTQGNRAGH